MQFGNLHFDPVAQRPELLAAPVCKAIEAMSGTEVYVAEIDPFVSDTAAFCERYAVSMDTAANCVILEAKRADTTWYAACVVLASARADINGIIRRQLEARKLSFASMEDATSHSHMEYGAITPIGLPVSWPILVDAAATTTPYVIIGSGMRVSKLLIPGALLQQMPGATVLPLAKQR